MVYAVAYQELLNRGFVVNHKRVQRTYALYGTRRKATERKVSLLQRESR